MSCRRSTSHETVADAHLPVVDIIAFSKFVCKGGKFLETTGKKTLGEVFGLTRPLGGELRTFFGACAGSRISVGADAPEAEKHGRADSGSRDHDEKRKPPASKRLREVAADLARDGRPDV